jgi:hypothetical protein
MAELLQNYGIWMGIRGRNCGAKYPCGLWVRLILTMANNKEPIKHEEFGKNPEDDEIIFQRWLDRVIERMWRTEIRTGRVYNGIPNNPVGFVEDF